MKFYNIKDDFIAFLRQFDSKVAEQKRIAWKIEALFARLEAIQNELS